MITSGGSEMKHAWIVVPAVLISMVLGCDMHKKEPEKTPAEEIKPGEKPAEPPKESGPVEHKPVDSLSPGGTDPKIDPVEVKKPGEENGLKPIPPDDKTPKNVKAREYTIQKGDTYYNIAARFLGDGKRWREIQALNPNVDYKDLRIGQVILIPKE